MAYIPSSAFSIQYFDDNGNPAVNHTFEFLITGTSTPATVAFDSAGVATATSTTVGSEGFQENGGTPVQVFFDDAVTYDIVRKDAAAVAYGPTIVGFTVPNTTNDGAQSVLASVGSAADAITADIAPAPASLSDQLQVVVELNHGANTITTPTFNLNSLGGVTIVRDTNDPLVVGDTAGSGYKLQLNYSAALSAWVLLNPTIAQTINIEDGAATTDKIPDGNVTYAKVQNVAGNNVLLGNDNGAGSDVQELNAAEVRTLIDFDTEVSNNTDVAANTAKVSNATHTGDVTGSTALTIAAGAVDIPMLANGTDGELITWDSSGSPATVGVGTAGEALTSNGSGAAPTFQTKAYARVYRTSSTYITTTISVMGTAYALNVDSVSGTDNSSAYSTNTGTSAEIVINETYTSLVRLTANIVATGETTTTELYTYEIRQGASTVITSQSFTLDTGDGDSHICLDWIGAVTSGSKTFSIYVTNDSGTLDTKIRSFTFIAEKIQ